MDFEGSTLFVVHNDEGCQELIRGLATRGGLVAKPYTTAEAFLDDYDSDGKPSCLVTGLRLPSISGIGLLKKLREQDRRIPTIALTAVADVPSVVELMQLGALTVLQNPFNDLVLWDAIRDGLDLARSQQRDQQERRMILSRLEELTKQERDVMNMIIEGLSNKVMASRLDVSIRTVETRRQQVFSKTGTKSVAQLVLAKTKAEQFCQCTLQHEKRSLPRDV